jgi:hypothetical protein
MNAEQLKHYQYYLYFQQEQRQQYEAF